MEGRWDWVGYVFMLGERTEGWGVVSTVEWARQPPPATKGLMDWHWAWGSGQLISRCLILPPKILLPHLEWGPKCRWHFLFSPTLVSLILRELANAALSRVIKVFISSTVIRTVELVQQLWTKGWLTRLDPGFSCACRAHTVGRQLVGCSVGEQGKGPRKWSLTM